VKMENVLLNLHIHLTLQCALLETPASVTAALKLF